MIFIAPERKIRADAQRNRERILKVAKRVFTQEGATASLEEIVRQAGVGPGTLYRHFPSRDDLLEAIYQSEVAKLAEAEQHYAETLPPLEALRAWMLHFIDHVATKKLIMPALETVAGGSMRLIEGSRSVIHAAFRRAVERAIRSGDLRAETEPEDFIRALVGVFYTTANPGWEASARRIVDMLLFGSGEAARRPGTRQAEDMAQHTKR